MANYYTRAELYELVWDRPVTRVAADLGISDVALHKICRKHKIPVAPRGHWAKKAAGKRVKTIALPKVTDPMLNQAGIRGSLVRRYSDRVLAAREQSQTQTGSDEAGQEASDPKPSPYLERLKNKLENAKPRKDGFIKISTKQQFSISITPACTDRAILTMNRIVSTALARGFKLKPTEHGLAFLVDEDLIEFSLTETLKKVPHEPTKTELDKLKRWENTNRSKRKAGLWVSAWDKPEIPEFDQAPSGQLMVAIDPGYHSDGLRRRFSDGKTQQIENLTERTVTGIAVCAAAAVDRREEAARHKREMEEWEKRRREIERQRTLENKRSSQMRFQAATHLQLNAYKTQIIR